MNEHLGLVQWKLRGDLKFQHCLLMLSNVHFSFKEGKLTTKNTAHSSSGDSSEKSPYPLTQIKPSNT